MATVPTGHSEKLAPSAPKERVVVSDDQASRLRAMVQSLQGPGVSVFTYAERISPGSGQSAQPQRASESRSGTGSGNGLGAGSGVSSPDAGIADRATSDRAVPGRDVPTRSHRHAAGTAAAPVVHSAHAVPVAPQVTPIIPKVDRPAAPRTRRCPVVAITSGKGGVGKTTLSVNLAIALTSLKHRTTLLDADLGLANADVLCGISPTTRLDAAVEPGSCGPRALSQIGIAAPGGFTLVPGSVGVARMANLPEQHRRLIIEGLVGLEQSSDAVLIDTGAGLSDGVTAFVAAADVAVIVCTPEPTSIADAYALIKCVVHATRLRPASRPRFTLLVNQAQTDQEGQGVHARVAATAKRFLGIELPLLAILPCDPEVTRSIRARKPLMISLPGSPAAVAIAQASRQLARFLHLPEQIPAQPVRRGMLASFQAWLGAR
jgi:flagellar biosynthesis protein FlhG